MIEVRSLRVVFGRTVAIDALDLDIEPGITGLFGANGVGKTTLLRVLAGLQRPTAGHATIAGTPTFPAPEELRARVGYAGHAAGLYPRLTVAENMALFARLYGRSPARAAETIAQLELERFAATPAGGLSAGLARRAAVARALLHEPQVLLLDEPYANLDDDASAIVSAAIVAWCRPDRVAVIATHGAKKVKAYADAGIVLKAGQVVVAGTYQPQAAR